MMKKENKMKNPALYIIAGLLLLSCVVTGIYALYTTGKTIDDSARAAKWGVEVKAEGDGSTAFKSSYSDENGLSVQSDDNTALVVAPGTSGFVTFSVTGKPEVAVDVAMELGDASTLSMIKGPSDAGAQTKSYTYYPVQWTLKKSDSAVSDWSTVTAVTGCAKVSLDTINDYLKGVNVSKHVDANTDLTSYYQLSWTWPLSQNHDAEDTYIGNVAAGKVTDSNVITTEKFKLSVSVTQSGKAANE